MPGLPADSLKLQEQLWSYTGFPEAVRKGGIKLEYAAALFRTVLKQQPKIMVEIGLANGASTMTILAALSQLGGERLLISIDPGQSSVWGNAGINNVRANGFASRHRLIEAPDYLALPDLVRQHVVPEAAYVDGRHTFDYVLLDFFYLDKLLPVGGVIGFNDSGWTAIRQVLRFVKTHRKYAELDVGLKPNYKGRNFVGTIARRVVNEVNNDRWFEKSADWEPANNFCARF